jgi:hypothetical protein
MWNRIVFSERLTRHGPVYGCKPGQLAWVVKEVLDRGIKILPIKNAGEEVRAPNEWVH